MEKEKKQFQVQSGYSYAPRDISFVIREKVLVCALVVVILKT